MKQTLVGRSQQAADGRLLESDILGSLLGWERAILTVLDIDKVDLHLLLGTNTDNERRTFASSNDLVGVVDRLHEQTECALKLLDDGLGQSGEIDAWVLIVDILCELGNSFCVSLSLELETLALEESLQFLVVGDDAVVDNGELPFGVRSVVRIVSARASRIGPTDMRTANACPWSWDQISRTCEDGS